MLRTFSRNRKYMEQQNQPQGQQQQVTVKISDEILRGVYANLAVVSHSPEEFVIDFMTYLPNSPAATINSRVLVSPKHMKRISQAMQENLKRYEDQFGTIEPGSDLTSHIGFRTE